MSKNMTRAHYNALAYGAITGWVVATTLLTLGIWVDGRFGLMAWPAGIAALVLTASALIQAVDGGGIPPRSPRLDRAGRKRLRDERRRIALAAEIQRLEREAGLQ